MILINSLRTIAAGATARHAVAVGIAVMTDATTDVMIGMMTVGTDVMTAEMTAEMTGGMTAGTDAMTTGLGDNINRAASAAPQ